MSDTTSELLFVTAASSIDTLRERLLASPCLRAGRRPVVIHWNAHSAAEALNPVLDAKPMARWVVWVHQDVFLPEGWDEIFLSAAGQADCAGGLKSASIGVLGVYGVTGIGTVSHRVGRVRDRGTWLNEPALLPSTVDGIDELLFALPGNTPLRLDSALGFDFYGTDLVLQAQLHGLRAVVVDAPCEHWSSMPVRGPLPATLVDRVAQSGDVLESKWRDRLPLFTPLLDIHAAGDVRRFASAFASHSTTFVSVTGINEGPGLPDSGDVCAPSTSVTAGVDCLVCPKPDDHASAEFIFAWERLKGGMAAGVRLISMDGHTGDLQAAVASMPDHALVVLMPHARVIVPDSAINRLLDTHIGDPSLTAALAHDQHFPSPLPPDYCTQGGLDRYMLRLASLHDVRLPYEGQHRPLLTLTNVGVIRRQAIWSKAAWIGSVHVHDFSDYQGSTREDMIPFVPLHARRFMDVGGGEGGFLRNLRMNLRAAKENPGEADAAIELLETHLVELSPQACLIAQDSVDKVWQGDFASLQIPSQYDCISFLDTLEHTTEPLRWLKRARELLTPRGVVIASVPNVGHWSVIADLVEGRWDVSPVGIHCVTHLRFFTERGLRSLFHEAGLRITRLERVPLNCPTELREAWFTAAAANHLCAEPTSWNTYAFRVQAVNVEEHYAEPFRQLQFCKSLS